MLISYNFCEVDVVQESVVPLDGIETGDGQLDGRRTIHKLQQPVGSAVDKIIYISVYTQVDNIFNIYCKDVSVN